jgi:ATP-dependent DNA ligase
MGRLRSCHRNVTTPSHVHWVEARLVAEITYLTWTADNLLRHTVYVACEKTSRPIRCDLSEDLSALLSETDDKDWAQATDASRLA